MSSVKTIRSASDNDKELSILRNAVDNIEKNVGERLLKSEDVIKMIHIVEEFLKKKKLICYGGTAINNLLPKHSQFYNKDIEIPDYDFFSINPINDVKELADIYASEGFIEIEAKAGMHHGTYKLYVNFTPIADITYIVPEIFNSIKKDAIKVNGIMYAPPDYLRMSMYLELSRPNGDVSRWEKVLKRLILLNTYHPIKRGKCISEFSRGYEGKQDPTIIYNTIRDASSDLDVVLFGGFAMDLYSKYLTTNQKKSYVSQPDFDILSEDPYKSATMIKERLLDAGIKGIKIQTHKEIGELISTHYEIIVERDTVAFLYKPSACISFNNFRVGGKNIKIASIDTMLSMYMAFSSVDRSYYNRNRIMCMTQYLFDVQMKNRFKQKGLLQRFGIDCYGYQETLEDIRSKKAKKFRELSRGDKDYEEWFMKYSPVPKKSKPSRKKTKTNKSATKKKK